jgi:hypothetical protein
VGLLYSESDVTRVRYIGLKDLNPGTTIHFILSKLSIQQQDDFFSQLMLNEDGFAMQIYFTPLLDLEKYEVAAVMKHFGMSGDHDLWGSEMIAQKYFKDFYQLSKDEETCGDHNGYACVSSATISGQNECRKFDWSSDRICNSCRCY